MARYRHPRNLGRDDVAQFALDVGGERVTLDPEGCFECDPDDARPIASAHGVDLDEMRVDGTCEEVKSDGDVCGRDLPCPYHSED